MIKYKYIVLFTLCSLLYLFINTTSAKCPTGTYKIRGVVISDDNNPIQNSVISIFFDKHDQGYSGFSLENGEFEIKCLYDTYKWASLSGDVCGKTPSSITVIIHKNDFFSKRLIIKVKDLKKEDNIFLLPSIVLIKIHPNTLDLIK